MNKEFIQKLTGIVEANMANEAFGTEDLARAMGMSHSNLHRKLKTISNQTISQFIRETRLKKARELLLHKELTAAETAYRVGFGSPTYFNKCFHEYFGYAPGELRKEEHWSERDIPVEQPPERSHQSKIIIFQFVALLILIPFFIFLFDQTKLTGPIRVAEKSIAVLPFKYMSDEGENQYLADGMMDAILLHLSKIKDLRVISRTSVEQYRNTAKTISQIGKELEVTYILEGSFQLEGDKIRLILQLLKSKDEAHVWSSDYDRDWKDVFLVQSEVAETIASELNAAITPEEKQRIHKIPTYNLTAYDFYQRGKEVFDNNQDSLAMAKALILYKKALKMDSTFALAYCGLAGINYYQYYWKTFFAENFLDSVLILSDQALAYDSQCAEAYFFRSAYFYERAKPNDALKEIDKALKFNPNYWKAYSLRSNILGEGLSDYVGAVKNKREALLRYRGKDLPDLMRSMGRDFIDFGFPGLAKQYFSQALELEGDTNHYLLSLAWMEYCSENFEKAYQLAKMVNKKDSDMIDEFGLYALMSGHKEEAFNWGMKFRENLISKGKVDLYGPKGLGCLLWEKGRVDEAKFYFDQNIQYNMEIIKLGRWQAVVKGAYFDLAEVYAFMGDHQKAYLYLDEVLKNQFFPRWWIILFKYDPLLEPIRKEQRFQNIIREVESKYQAEHERLKLWLIAQGLL